MDTTLNNARSALNLELFGFPTWEQNKSMQRSDSKPTIEENCETKNLGSEVKRRETVIDREKLKM
jgi:hypothetical protein